MKFLPINIEIKGRRCLVVGGGAVAARKVAWLATADANITVIAPEVLLQLQQQLQQCGGHYQKATFKASDLTDYSVVIAATDDAAVNQQVSIAAKAKGLWVNVVDEPELSNFIVPALVDRSPLTVSVSSGGASPVLARWVRARIEALLPRSLGLLAAWVGTQRECVKATLPKLQQRRYFWEEVLTGAIAETYLSGQEQQAKNLFDQYLQRCQQQDATAVGTVYLVGAGPGDPELLTLRALRLLQQSDIILYDRLVSDAVLGYARRDAECIYVGKQRGKHRMPQEEINATLVKLAQQGNKVCRLKGGDPFIFGRGGEEVAALMASGVSFHVIPGVTAASGCACYAGFPLTHRDYAQSVHFVTGHLKHPELLALDWNNLVRPQQTLVFYMGLARLDEICQQLLHHGMASDTPIALVAQGTMPQQQVVVGQLDDFYQQVAATEIKAPSLVIVGDVVSLRLKMV